MDKEIIRLYWKLNDNDRHAIDTIIRRMAERYILMDEIMKLKEVK